jgi:hypothetical protein
MNKAINFLILYISIFLLEIVLCFFLILIFDGFSLKDGNFYLNRAWYGTGLWNFWRVLFYGLPFIILYFLLFKYVVNIKLYKPLLLSIFNLIVYVVLSVLSRVIWGKNVPLPPEGIMFWITCVAIFLSPLILGKVAYFRNRMETL